MKKSELIRIQERREKALKDGFTIDGIKFRLDDTFLTRLNTLVLTTSITDVIEDEIFIIPTTEGPIELTADLLQQVLFYAAIHISACYERELELIADAKSQQDYDLEDGWPETTHSSEDEELDTEEYNVNDQSSNGPLSEEDN